MEFSFKEVSIIAGTLIAIVIVIRISIHKIKNSYNKLKNISGDVHIGDKK